MRLHEWKIWGESVRDVPSGTEEDVSGNRDARATSPPRVSASGPRSIPVACGETHPVTGGSDAAFSFMVSEFRAWVAVAASRSGLRRSPRTERSCGAFRCGWRSERRRARRWRASLFGPTSNRNVRFSVLFFEKLTSKFVLRRVDAIRRVVTQKMSNAPLGGRQSGGTGGGQFSNRGPRRNSNGRIVEKRSHFVPCWMRQTRAWKTPASAVIIIWRDEPRSRPFSVWAESRVGGSVGSRGATPHAV